MSQRPALRVIIGAGGHARMIVDALRAAGDAENLIALDSDPTRWNTEFEGVSIAGGDDLLPQLAAAGARCFAVSVGATGDNAVRQRLFAAGVAAGLQPLTVVHPSAIVSAGARLAPGVQIFPGAVVNTGSCLGANVIINSAAVVEHDCTLDEHVHLAPRAVLASTVAVGRGAHVGVGAVVRQCLRIGEWAIVGAGAVVIRDVAPRAVVVGVPARPIRER